MIAQAGHNGSAIQSTTSAVVVNAVMATATETHPVPSATSIPITPTQQLTPTPDIFGHLIPHTPESTPGPDTCGAWSDASISSSPAAVLNQKYGELRNCVFFENAWIILTEGLQQQDGTRKSGIVAVYRCNIADSLCLDGQEDHPLSGWQIYEPPCPGELSVGPDSLPGKLQIFGTCASYFEASTGIFSNH